MRTLSTLAEHPRVRVRRGGSPDPDGRAIVYWMQRAQRARDNPALDVAIEAANLLGLPVVAFFCLVPSFPGANLRHYDFMVRALPDIGAGLERRHVGFVVRPDTPHSVEAFCDEVGAALLVGDENPLRATEAWRRRVAERLRRAVLDGRRRRRRAGEAAREGAVRRPHHPAADPAAARVVPAPFARDPRAGALATPAGACGTARFRGPARAAAGRPPRRPDPGPRGGAGRRPAPLAGVHPARAFRLRDGPQPPGTRRHEPAVALPPLRPSRAA